MTHICLNCGKQFKPSRNSTGKYCSLQCQQDYQHKQRVIAWKNGETNGLSGEYSLAKYIRRYMLEKAGHRCERCGWCEVHPVTGKSPLEVHHKDGNYLNNSEDNLEVLCPNCHSLNKTYKNTGGHAGRKGRKKYS